MPISPYGGIIFAAFAAVGGALDAQPAAIPQSTGVPQPTKEITLAADESATVDQIRAICARESAEIISASADPATGTSLHLALVNGQGDFLNGGLVEIAGKDIRSPHLRMRCRGEWLMLKLAPGSYTIRAEAGGEMRERSVDVPDYGRVRLAMNLGPAQAGPAS
jgi:hypothetical protein